MSTIANIPEIRMGIVAVSRDCFPIELAASRLKKVVAACEKQGITVIPADTIIENEEDALIAADEMAEKGINAVTVYLGNFGPEGPATIFAETAALPFMLVGAAEEDYSNMINGRGDAFCGMLNASLNCGLRHLMPYIPPSPIGLPDQVAGNIAHFTNIARVIVGIMNLKIFSFGPRPHDFYACNAPIKPFYDLGIEVMENSELDMYKLYKDAAEKTDEIEAVRNNMEEELGVGNGHPEKLAELAQFEVALTHFMDDNLGSRQFAVFANKCWPAFQPMFGFTPCYVNSRFAARGIPIACEVDMYGALSEYMLVLASQQPATILDINNTCPPDMPIKELNGAAREDLFMGFHCGNTPKCMLCEGCAMKHQLIMHRLMEPDDKPNITCGTLEGRLKPGPTTVFRLQSTADCDLQSYLAEGHILDADPKSFGAIGAIAVPDFARFYRHVLIEKQYPHHAALGSAHVGRVIYDAVKLLGIEDLSTPKKAGDLYPNENPF
jgi:L-fucose isomerase-like protein